LTVLAVQHVAWSQVPVVHEVVAAAVMDTEPAAQVKVLHLGAAVQQVASLQVPVMHDVVAAAAMSTLPAVVQV
jgi:hypothetical protein